MKRKGILALLIALLLALVFLLPGCKAKNYRVRSLSEINGGETAITVPKQSVDDIDIPKVPWTKGPKEFTIKVNGVSYTGQSNAAYINNDTNSIFLHYSRDNRNDDGPRDFFIRDTDHKLVYIDYFKESFYEEDGKKPFLPPEEIRQKVIKAASEWIPTKEYALTCEVLPATEYRSEVLYNYRFLKTVSGIETTDYVDILISDRGSLITMEAPEPNWTKEHQFKLNAFSVEKATEAAIEASGLSNPEVEMRRFARSKDGEVFLWVRLRMSGAETPVDLAVSTE